MVRKVFGFRDAYNFPKSLFGFRTVPEEDWDKATQAVPAKQDGLLPFWIDDLVLPLMVPTVVWLWHGDEWREKVREIHPLAMAAKWLRL